MTSFDAFRDQALTVITEAFQLTLERTARPGAAGTAAETTAASAPTQHPTMSEHPPATNSRATEATSSEASGGSRLPPRRQRRKGACSRPLEFRDVGAAERKEFPKAWGLVRFSEKATRFLGWDLRLSERR
jgi:hypothetical protein